MKTLEEIRNDVKEREAIMVNVLSFHRDFEFISNPPTPEMIKFLSRNPILIRSKTAFVNSMCIEIHKLFSDSKSDDFRFSILMADIIGYRSVHSDFLSDSIVSELKGLLERCKAE